MILGLNPNEIDTEIRNKSKTDGKLLALIALTDERGKVVCECSHNGLALTIFVVLI